MSDGSVSNSSSDGGSSSGGGKLKVIIVVVAGVMKAVRCGRGHNRSSISTKITNYMLFPSFFTLGRAGEKGTAYTLVTDKDKEFAGHLVRNLEGAAQEVPKELLDLAMQSSWFRKSRFKQGKAKALGGRGLGFRERPGLGSTPANETAGENY